MVKGGVSYFVVQALTLALAMSLTVLILSRFSGWT